jgi:hypothetical protein
MESIILSKKIMIGGRIINSMTFLIPPIIWRRVHRISPGQNIRVTYCREIKLFFGYVVYMHSILYYLLLLDQWIKAKKSLPFLHFFSQFPRLSTDQQLQKKTKAAPTDLPLQQSWGSHSRRCPISLSAK